MRAALSLSRVVLRPHDRTRRASYRRLSARLKFLVPRDASGAVLTVGSQHAQGRSHTPTTFVRNCVAFPIKLFYPIGRRDRQITWVWIASSTSSS